METFEKAIEFVLKNEGGYCEDSGGATKYGISQKAYPNIDIANLTKEDAIEIYRRDFWQPYKDFPEKIAIKVFDLAINMGHRQAVKILQRALKSCGASLKDDGILGPITYQCVSSVNPDLLIPALRSEAAGFYRTLTAQKPEHQRFLNGWLTRAYL